MNDLMQDIKESFPYEIVYLSCEQENLLILPCIYKLFIECQVTQYQLLSNDQLYDLMSFSNFTFGKYRPSHIEVTYEHDVAVIRIKYICNNLADFCNELNGWTRFNTNCDKALTKILSD
jgi:hypothetical protein